MPPRFPRDIQPTVLRDTPKTQASYAYGTFTLYGAPFQATSASRPGFYTGALQPHIPWVLTTQGSVCPLPLSVAPTHGIPVGFFSCGY